MQFDLKFKKFKSKITSGDWKKLENGFYFEHSCTFVNDHKSAWWSLSVENNVCQQKHKIKVSLSIDFQVFLELLSIWPDEYHGDKVIYWCPLNRIIHIVIIIGDILTISTKQRRKQNVCHFVTCFDLR